MHTHTLTLDALWRRDRVTLARTARFCARHGWWPSCVDLLRDPGRSRRSRWAIRRDMLRLSEKGLVVQITSRQWAVTIDGFRLLGMEPVSAKRRWRDTRWRDRLRRAAFEVYERVEELPVEEV